jgi:hypothetical protein
MLCGPFGGLASGFLRHPFEQLPLLHIQGFTCQIPVPGVAFKLPTGGTFI